MMKLTTLVMEQIRQEGYLPQPDDVRDMYAYLSRSVFDGSSLPQSTIGLKYLDCVFPHRFRAKSAGSMSLHDAFFSDVEMRRAINYVFETGREPTKDLVLRNLKFNTRTPSHFFPHSAAALCSRFARGGSVFDAFTGWGGRSLGAICSGVSDLVSTDTQRESMKSGCRLASDLAELSPTRCKFIHSDFSEYMASTDRRFDLILASPPFLDTEDYGDGKDRTLRQWSSELVVPLAKLSRRVLSDFGMIATHGQDRPSMPVSSMLYTAFSCAGFILKHEYKYGKKPGQSVMLWTRA